MDAAEPELLRGNSRVSTRFAVFAREWFLRKDRPTSLLRANFYSESLKIFGSRLRRRTQPFTLILENDRIAVPGRGLPINVAGRKVVKINMFLI
jgi:hypothetical protein